MEVEYKVDWLDQLRMIADKCDQRPTRVTVRDLRDAISTRMKSYRSSRKPRRRGKDERRGAG